MYLTTISPGNLALTGDARLHFAYPDEDEAAKVYAWNEDL